LSKISINLQYFTEILPIDFVQMVIYNDTNFDNSGVVMNDETRNTSWLYRYNPVIQLVIRPALKLVDAHNHPIRGGIVAAVGYFVTHSLYLAACGLICLINLDGAPAWLVLLVQLIFLVGFVSVVVASIGNFSIGLKRFRSGQYGDRKSKHESNGR